MRPTLPNFPVTIDNAMINNMVTIMQAAAICMYLILLAIVITGDLNLMPIMTYIIAKAKSITENKLTNKNKNKETGIRITPIISNARLEFFTSF